MSDAETTKSTVAMPIVPHLVMRFRSATMSTGVYSRCQMVMRGSPASSNSMSTLSTNQ